MKYIPLWGGALLVSSGNSYASGQEVLSLPAGQLLGLIIAFIMLVHFKVGKTCKVISMTLSVFVVIFHWFIPRNYLPKLLGGSSLADFFIEGIYPPVIITGILIIVFSLLRKPKPKD